MANKANRDTLGLTALSGFLKGYADTKEQRRKEARDDDRFERELALRAVEQEQRKREAAFSAYRALTDDVAQVQKGTASQIYKDHITGRPISETSPIYTPEAAIEVQNALQMGFQKAYPGADYTLPGVIPQAASVGLPGGKGGKGVDPDPFGYKKKLAEEAARKISGAEDRAPQSGANNAVLDRVMANLDSGAYNPGPISGRAAQFTQPAFQADINSIQGIAVSEMAQFFKGAMSDRDVKLMIESKFTPNIDDPEALKRSLASLRAVAIENQRQAEELKKYGLTNNGDFSGYVAPPPSSDVQAAINELQPAPQTAPQAVAPVSPEQPIAEFTRDANGKLRRVK